MNEKSLQSSSTIENGLSINSIFLSLIVVMITLMSFSSIIENSVIKPRLYDGSINELGRYSMTFDAYQHIESESENSIIAIGSSKMREAFDGITIGDLFDNTYDFYNLALAGDRPYVRMLEIEALINAKPKYVILEVGPNTFSYLSTPVPDSTLSRMAHLSSLGQVDLQSYPESVLNVSDYDLLPNDYFSQKNHIASYSLDAIENTIDFEIFDEEKPWSCGGKRANVRCVPLPQNSSFDDYLRYPIQFSNTIERIKSGAMMKWSIDEFYGEMLDKYINGSYHNPEGHKNKNQVSFEYMINEFENAGISVVLVGLPYNPVLIDRLQPGQWDYYNQSINTYIEEHKFVVFDMLWDEDWEELHFNDYTHMSREGEMLFAEKFFVQLSDVME